MPGRLSDWATHHLFWINRMNKKDLALFKAHVRKWRDKIGVRDWAISVDASEIDEDRDAECSTDAQNRCVLVSINQQIENTTDKQLNECALHEVLEISLTDIRELMNVFYSWEFVDGIIHQNIRRMENALR